MINRIIILFTLVLMQQVFALDLELTQGINSALPIAINSFSSDKASQEIAQIIEKDLNFSGQFRIVSGPQGPNAHSSVTALKQLGADSVVTGRVNQVGGRYEISFTLVDAMAKGATLLTKNLSN